MKFMVLSSLNSLVDGITASGKLLSSASFSSSAELVRVAASHPELTHYAKYANAPAIGAFSWEAGVQLLSVELLKLLGFNDGPLLLDPIGARPGIDARFTIDGKQIKLIAKPDIVIYQTGIFPEPIPVSSFANEVKRKATSEAALGQISGEALVLGLGLHNLFPEEENIRVRIMRSRGASLSFVTAQFDSDYLAALQLGKPLPRPQKLYTYAPGGLDMFDSSERQHALAVMNGLRIQLIEEAEARKSRLGNPKLSKPLPTDQA